jgi:putative DNA primase/helicase
MPPPQVSTRTRTAKATTSPRKREKLISIGLDAELWHDGDGNSFASVTITGHFESHAINSRAFRNWLTRTYGDRHPIKIGGKTCPSAPSTQSLGEALNALSAKAASGAEHQPAVRVGESGGLIYLDLGTSDWNAVEISAGGWRVIPIAPVRFVRPAGLRPLPVPVPGGHILELRNFLNVGSDADFVLIVSWLIASLRPIGPYPVLIINGEQGAGKSIACRVLRRLIDPNGAELRTEPRDERDLMLAAKNGWIVALDNLSYVRNDLSDAICRIATKGGFATRSLYTNEEEFLLEVCRPVLINGIPPLASRADLTDRAIVCVLPTMPEGMRRTEDDYWSAFDDASPRLLGALLDAVSGAMRLYPSVQLQQAYRMMDFAKWAEAAWQALGYPPGTFERAYRQNRAFATDDAVDADPIAGALINLINARGGFTGTATTLLTALEAIVLPGSRDRRWPKDATRLSNHLRRLPPLLRPRGLEIFFDERTADARRDRLIVIKRVGTK